MGDLGQITFGAGHDACDRTSEHFGDSGQVSSQSSRDRIRQKGCVRHELERVVRLVRSVEFHHHDVRLHAKPVRLEVDHIAIAAEERPRFSGGMVGEILLVRTITVHDPDIVVPRAVRSKDDLRAIRRHCRLEVASRIRGELALVAAIDIHTPNIASRVVHNL